MTKQKKGPNIDVRSPAPRSVVGVDAGLASFACAHVERDAFVEMRSGFEKGPIEPSFRLRRGSVYVPPVFGDRSTVAEENAWRAAHLLRWLRPVLGQAVSDGAEAFHAERYEQLRQASAAAKYSAGHAVLVAASALCEPRPRLQYAGYGGPAFVSGREAKRAATGCDVATKAVVMAAARRLIGGMGEALRGMLAEFRPHLADAGIVALHALGHRERPILLGEAPKILGEVPFDGPRGDQLDALFIGKRGGRSSALGTCFELRDLLDEPVIAFPMSLAEPAAQAMEASFTGRAVIFAGHRVAKAFGVGASTKPLVWFEHAAVADAGKRGAQPSAYMAAVLPDLGGWWWNQPKNAARARVFLRAAGRVS